jgi:hypothetical protein
MTIAVLLRLLLDDTTAGRLVGRAELVDTGQIFAFRDASELTSLLARLSAPDTADETEAGAFGASAQALPAPIA